MADYETTIPSRWAREPTFDYMADFTNVAEWDPSISRVELVSGVAGAEGATYAVTLSVAGRETTISYTALQVVRPVRVVLRGETDAVVSTDTISVGQNGTGVSVTYHAELALKGVRRLADPLADVLLTRASEKARAGLEEVLTGVRPR
jgi:hypothetical protein